MRRTYQEIPCNVSCNAPCNGMDYDSISTELDRRATDGEILDLWKK